MTVAVLAKQCSSPAFINERHRLLSLAKRALNNRLPAQMQLMDSVKHPFPRSIGSRAQRRRIGQLDQQMPPAGRRRPVRRQTFTTGC